MTEANDEDFDREKTGKYVLIRDFPTDKDAKEENPLFLISEMPKNAQNIQIYGSSAYK